MVKKKKKEKKKRITTTPYKCENELAKRKLFAQCIKHPTEQNNKKRNQKIQTEEAVGKELVVSF